MPDALPAPKRYRSILKGAKRLDHRRALLGLARRERDAQTLDSVLATRPLKPPRKPTAGQ